MTKDTEALREAVVGNTAIEKIAILSNKDWPLARVDTDATLDMIHEIAVEAIYPTAPTALATPASAELGFDPPSEVGDEVFPHDTIGSHYGNGGGLDPAAGGVAPVEYGDAAQDAVMRLLERGVATVNSDGYLVLAHPPHPAPVDPALLDRAETAWQRFFYPANDCFDKSPAANKLPCVDLEVADCLRLLLAAVGRNVQAPATGEVGVPVDPVAGGEALREGPAPIPNTRMQCFGCKHLDTKDWREPSGDGETFDSGTEARCKAVPTEHGGQCISVYWSRTNDAPKWCPFLAALKGPAA